MKISLDFDKTYTLAPDVWDSCLRILRGAGHEVFVVTMRYDTGQEADEVRQALSGKVDGFIFTCRKAKVPYTESIGQRIDVWIDDSPYWLLNGG
jgi:DNA-binding LacI/PurR family transcriptional regulator